MSLRTHRTPLTTRTVVRHLTAGEQALFAATMVGFLYALAYGLPLLTAEPGTATIATVVYFTLALVTFGGLAELWRVNCERELEATKRR